MYTMLLSVLSASVLPGGSLRPELFWFPTSIVSLLAAVVASIDCTMAVTSPFVALILGLLLGGFSAEDSELVACFLRRLDFLICLGSPGIWIASARL